MESYVPIAYGFFGTMVLAGIIVVILYFLKKRMQLIIAHGKRSKDIEGAPKSPHLGGLVSRDVNPLPGSVAPLHTYLSQKVPKMQYESDGMYANVTSIKNNNGYIMKPVTYAYADKWRNLFCNTTKCADTAVCRISEKAPSAIGRRQSFAGVSMKNKGSEVSVYRNLSMCHNNRRKSFRESTIRRKSDDQPMNMILPIALNNRHQQPNVSVERRQSFGGTASRNHTIPATRMNRRQSIGGSVARRVSFTRPVGRAQSFGSQVHEIPTHETVSPQMYTYVQQLQKTSITKPLNRRQSLGPSSVRRHSDEIVTSYNGSESSRFTRTKSVDRSSFVCRSGNRNNIVDANHNLVSRPSSTSSRNSSVVFDRRASYVTNCSCSKNSSGFFDMNSFSGCANCNRNYSVGNSVRPSSISSIGYGDNDVFYPQATSSRHSSSSEASTSLKLTAALNEVHKLSTELDKLKASLSAKKQNQQQLSRKDSTSTIII